MITIVCDKCQHEFDLDKPSETEVEIYGKKLTLVYFTCPKCNEIYKVCLRDAKFYELQEDLEKTKKRMRRNRGRNNESVYTMLMNLSLNKQHKLERHMQVLNGKYTGTFTFTASENNSMEQKIIYLPRENVEN